MAKKGAVQLQQELTTDEDWNRMLHVEGLLVVDIYPEWAGPCSAMIATLRKVKIELQADNLYLAIAKADTISYLERFRDTCEPTWMFIVNGKMVNLMYGASAPQLMNLIAKELKNEAAVRNGTQELVAIPISEMAPEEKIRYDVIKAIEDEKQRIAKEKSVRQIKERRLAVANVVLNNVGQNGVILVFPQAISMVKETFADLWEPAGLAIATYEKPQLTERTIEELLYFADTQFCAVDVESLLEKPILAWLVKPTNADAFNDDIDTVLSKFVYGISGCPPGSPDSPAQLLMAHIPVVTEQSELALQHASGPSLSRITSTVKPSTVVIESKVHIQTEKNVASKADIRSKIDISSKTEMRSKTEMHSKIDMSSKTRVRSKEFSKLEVSGTTIITEKEVDTIDLTGLWVPPNSLTKGIAIKLFFPRIYDPIAIPEPVPTPPHVAIAFDALKRKEILNLMDDYPNDIMRYGFFTDDNPDTAKLIAKTLPRFEQIKIKSGTTGEKLIIQLSRKRSEAWCFFSQLNPTFMSHTPEDGELQCKKLFAENYDDIEEELEEEVVVKKKKGKEAVVEVEIVVEEVLAEEEGKNVYEEEGEGKGVGEGEGEVNFEDGISPPDDEAN